MKKIVILYHLALSVMSISPNIQAFPQPIDAEHIKNMHCSVEGLPEKIDMDGRSWSYKWMTDDSVHKSLSINICEYVWQTIDTLPNQKLIYIPNHSTTLRYELLELHAEPLSYRAPPGSPRY